MVGTGSLTGRFVTSLVDTSVSLTSRSDTSVLSVLLVVRSDPVDSGVSSNGLMVRVNENDFVEFEGSVLSNPVRVEDSQVAALSSDSLFGHSSVRSGWFQLIDTLIDGFTVNDSLGNGLLSTTSSDSNSIDDISLLGFITELSCLVDSAGSVTFVDDGELSVFPGSHS